MVNFLNMPDDKIYDAIIALGGVILGGIAGAVGGFIAGPAGERLIAAREKKIKAGNIRKQLKPNLKKGLRLVAKRQNINEVKNSFFYKDTIKVSLSFDTGESKVSLPEDKSINRIIKEITTGEGYRAIINAPGGSGKTSFLLRLTDKALIDKNIFLVYFDLAVNKTLRKRSDEFSLENFFDFYSIHGMTLERFQELLNEADILNRQILIIIDGMNHQSIIDKDKINECINALLKMGKSFRYSSVLITERDKNTSLDHMQKISVSLLDCSEVNRHIKNSSFNESNCPDFLRYPLYLNMAKLLNKKGLNNFTSRTQLIKSYINVSLDERLLPELTRAAFNIYATNKSTEIEQADFKELLENEHLFEQLRKSKLISTVEKNGLLFTSFYHQTIHDYLSARYLAEQGPSEWSNKNFDIISLKSSSEAIELLAEITAFERQYSTEALLKEIYDWNLDATLRIISRLDAIDLFQSQVDNRLKWAIYILNIEKKFEIFSHSRNKTERNFKTLLPEEAKKAWAEIHGADPNQFTIWVNQLPVYTNLDPQVHSYWIKWLEVFNGSLPLEEIMSCIHSDTSDALLGWTAANSLRRKSDTFDMEQVFESAKSMYENLKTDGWKHEVNRARRWKVVHLLGRNVLEENIDFLLEIACELNEYEWVRYGAIRSCIEAIRLSVEKPVGQNMLEAHIGKLADRIPDLIKGSTKHKKHIEEFLSSEQLFSVNYKSDDWDNEYTRILNALKEQH